MQRWCPFFFLSRVLYKRPSSLPPFPSSLSPRPTMANNVGSPLGRTSTRSIAMRRVLLVFASSLTRASGAPALWLESNSSGAVACAAAANLTTETEASAWCAQYCGLCTYKEIVGSAWETHDYISFATETTCICAVLDSTQGDINKRVELTAYGDCYAVYGTGKRSGETDGMDGDDLMCGRDVDDEGFRGGPGDDELHAMGGNDLDFEGERGNDRVFGGEGNDELFYGSYGDDRIYGGPGDDRGFYGSYGNDMLDAGPGNDHRFYGDYGDDTLYAGPGNDHGFYGGNGNDLLDTGPGSYDHGFYGGNGDDLLDTGPGSLVVGGGSGLQTCAAGTTRKNDYCVPDPAAFAEDSQLQQTYGLYTNEYIRENPERFTLEVSCAD